MPKAKSFVRTTLLGGLVVVLPATIVAVVFRWLFYKVTDWIQPLTDALTRRAALPEIVADLIVVAVLLAACFLIGLAVRTTVGRLLFERLEARVLRAAPGYNLVKETVNQFLGRKQTPFSAVALARIFDNDTRVTAFVTDEQDAGALVTVFVPTGPNPTSGQIFHLPRGQVTRLAGVGVEQAMRSIISCGAGSASLLAAAGAATASSPGSPTPAGA